MDSHFGRWKPEDQPSTSDVDARQRQNILKKCPVGIRVLTVDDRMRATQHSSPHYSYRYRLSIGVIACASEINRRSITFQRGNVREWRVRAAARLRCDRTC